MGYHRPNSLSDALALLAEGKKTVLAGGTDLYPATDRPELDGNVLDITGISALRGVERQAGAYRIGAASKWSEIIAADLPPAFDALKLSAREVGSIQIQNSGTIGGNLCNASPAADGVPPLLVLDAQVELASLNGVRRMPLSKFIAGNRRTELAQNEILSAIVVPEASTSGQSHFLKLGARKYLVISIAMVAVKLVLDSGKIAHACVSVGSCSEVATRLPDLEARLIGASPTDALDADLITSSLSPIGDIRADAPYRNTAASELVARALKEASE